MSTPDIKLRLHSKVAQLEGWAKAQKLDTLPLSDPRWRHYAAEAAKLYKAGWDPTQGTMTTIQPFHEPAPTQAQAIGRSIYHTNPRLFAFMRPVLGR